MYKLLWKNVSIFCSGTPLTAIFHFYAKPKQMNESFTKSEKNCEVMYSLVILSTKVIKSIFICFISHVVGHLVTNIMR